VTIQYLPDTAQIRKGAQLFQDIGGIGRRKIGAGHDAMRMTAIDRIIRQ
jgi:hypothetical protein